MSAPSVIGLWIYIGALLSATVARADIVAHIAPERASLFIHQPFTLVLRIQSPVPPDTPDVAGTPGLVVTRVTPPGFSADTTQTSHVFRVEMIAERAGVFTLPPIPIRVGDSVIKTEPVRLTILAPRLAQEMTLAMDVSATHVYVDEPVTLTVTWSSQTAFTRYQDVQLELPALRSKAWDVYPLDPGVPEAERVGMPVNGQRVIARKVSAPDKSHQLIFAYKLVPRTAGEFRPAEARMSCALLRAEGSANRYPSYFDNAFFNAPDPNIFFERVYLAAPSPTLTARPLPEAGRTARYAGIAGPCVPTASVQPMRAIVGQPMLLMVKLEQVPYAPAIPSLPAATLTALGPEFFLVRTPLRESATDHERTFTYILRPLRSGMDRVPALPLQIFDPAQGAYATVRTAPLPIAVAPDGDHTFYRPEAVGADATATPLNGIRNNREASVLLMNEQTLIEAFPRVAWIFWLLPPLLWWWLRPWVLRRERARRDPAYARAIHALRDFRRHVNTDTEAAWRTYLADRLDLHAEAVTFESVRRELARFDMDPVLVNHLREHFARQDAARYAPSGATHPPAPDVRALVRKMEKATRRFFLLSLMIFSTSRADAGEGGYACACEKPNAVFAQALRLRAEKPDEAQPLFIEAALNFETDRAFFNAGNSWFFAGQPGRALANFRAAERRNPFDKHVRDSIAFIRAQRVNTFPAKNDMTGRLARLWRPFSRWHPVLHGVGITAIYLLGWMLYITARFIGRAPPRAVWVALIALAAPSGISLACSLFQPQEGVVLEETMARLGPGYAYEPAYKELLREATELHILETRDGWVCARLPDDHSAWIPTSACMEIK